MTTLSVIDFPNLWVNNDNFVRARLILGPDMTPLAGAVVTLDVVDEAGAEVVAQQALVEGSDVSVTLGDGSTATGREYATTIDKAAPFVPGRAYTVRLDAAHPAGHDGYFEIRRVAKIRTG